LKPLPGILKHKIEYLFVLIGFSFPIISLHHPFIPETREFPVNA